MKDYDSQEYEQDKLDEAFIYSIEVNDFDSIEALLKAGASVLCFQNKAFNLVASDGNLELFKFLFKKITKNSTEYSAIIQNSLLEASYFGHLELVKYLYKQGSQNSNNLFFKHTLFAMKECVDNNQLNVLKFFVQKKIPIHYNYDELLRIAEKNKFDDMKNYLISIGANPNATKEYQLIQSIISGLNDFTVQLINKEHVNLRCYLDAPIKLACQTNNIIIAQHLVNKGIPFSLVEQIVNSRKNVEQDAKLIPDIIKWVNSTKLSLYLDSQLSEKNTFNLPKIKI